MTVRTSESDPLQIAELPVGAGKVGITLCPGKQGESSYGDSWRRDLATDLGVIQAWGARAVVTLLEAHEFELLKVPTLPQAVRRLGIEWHALPIRDVGVPDESFEARWVYAGARLRERLRAGERLLVHCRGGLGRAGLVAARVLVEFGAAPAAAIAAVRSVRPGAIETPAQEAWVLRTGPIDTAHDRRTARWTASLLGGAIGDALGYRVEFASLADIRSQYGVEGVRLAVAKGMLEVSDDTQMTLFTLEGQLRAARKGEPLIDSIRHAYLDWLATQAGPAGAGRRTGLAAQRLLCRAQAPGNTCLAALRGGGRGTPDIPINDSKGCGGVMRTAPLGFLGESVDDEAVYRLGVQAAALTHGHPDGYAPAGVMALAVRRLSQDAKWEAVVHAGLGALVAHPAATGTRRLLQEVQESLQGEVRRSSASFGQGWVGDEALAVGLHAAATAGSFAQAIEVAANHDGDSDSTASIAGQLYGARHGVAALPAEAVYRLDVLEPLLGLVGEWGQIAKL